MSQIRVRRPKAEAPAGPVTQQQVNRHLAWAVGSELFAYRDPLFHITESFQTTFDQMGRHHVSELAGSSPDQHQEGQERQSPQGPDPTSMRGPYLRRDPAQQDMLRKFSETAFSRGTLSAAVLRGTGKMMLFSCLKRTVYQS